MAKYLHDKNDTKISNQNAKTTELFASVKKRDGRIVPFDRNRIANAVFRAMQATGEGNATRDSLHVAEKVIKELLKKFPATYVPSIEEIQDVVEEALIVSDFPKTAKAYIIYRRERNNIRAKKQLVPEHIKKLALESKKYFKNSLAEFIYYRSYSRWIEEENRRETWIETVDRYMHFMHENIGDKLQEAEYAELREAILQQEVMPSMRLMWSAGKAARKTNVCAYNCSYIAPAKLEDFAEIMFLSMCGTGVGFSVESQAIQRLPIIKRFTEKKLPTHIITDSKEGWCKALTLGLKTWYSGRDIAFDYSQLRPAGAPLHTMGGKSSGPEPLRALLDFAREKILRRQGRRLTNLDAHDIICKIGEVVVSGGVRRSALISLSDLEDYDMRAAKMGQFYLLNPQRSMANNSAVYNEKPSASEFLDEWIALAKSGSGERGIFNRAGLPKQLPLRRWKIFQKLKPDVLPGTNPCGEIILQSKQFCNLTEVVARAGDDENALLKKIRLAAILGTYQATLTNFPFLSAAWKNNCEKERLLGVSITGQWDCDAVRSADVFKRLRARAIEINGEYAKRFGINPSSAITCVKPSGTVSQLVDASSGMHPRHAPYYIRRIRISATDKLFHMMKDQKFPYHPEVGQADGSANTYVLEFPVKTPLSSAFRNDFSALAQLEYWKIVKENFTEHNPSVTISVGDDEWIKVANWLYENWDMIGGLSFLPRNEHVYKLAPYEEIDEKRYHELMSKLPDIDFSQIVTYEDEDMTSGAKELACVSGVCEIDFSSESAAVSAATSVALPSDDSAQSV